MDAGVLLERERHGDGLAVRLDPYRYDLSFFVRVAEVGRLRELAVLLQLHVIAEHVRDREAILVLDDLCTEDLTNCRRNVDAVRRERRLGNRSRTVKDLDDVIAAVFREVVLLGSERFVRLQGDGVREDSVDLDRVRYVRTHLTASQILQICQRQSRRTARHHE